MQGGTRQNRGGRAPFRGQILTRVPELGDPQTTELRARQTVADCMSSGR